MAFIWVQYYAYGPLPTIFENPMGDVPAPASSPAEQTGQSRQDISSPGSQYHQVQQQRQSSNPQSSMAQQQAMPFPNMTSLAGALPYAPSYPQQSQHSQQQFTSAMQSQSAVAYQIAQHTAQFGAQQPMGQSNPAFNVHYQQFQGYPVHPNLQQSSMQQGSSQNQQYFPNQAFISPQQSHQGPQLYYPQGSYAQQQLYQLPQQYDRSGLPNHSIAHGFRGSNEHLSLATSGSPANRSSSSGTPGSMSPSVPRGPPRKPKQSGNALWVGNLPPGANIVDLKDHFSRDCTNEIESVFLISKSNCAFVNYKTEAGCASAMARFHESKFNGARLVCRLRRPSTAATAAAGVPTGPAALTSQQPPVAKTPVPGSSSQPESSSSGAKVNSEGIDATQVRDKYFIVKSLTMEDLESSVRSEVWATQSHNEEALNKAYETADNVYLIFSANKSGEYFGYARMVSAINNDPAAAIEFAPKAQAIDDPDQPKAIPTEATATAPKGRIIDDSARGTIFWEAESDPELDAVDSADVVDGVDGVHNEEETDTKSQKSDKEVSTEESKAWGKPFKLKWESTNRLPFYRTRGLRNPWNSNREVKIARDGTELETSVGRRLIQMFKQNDSAPPVIQPMMGAGYPQMRFQ